MVAGGGMAACGSRTGFVGAAGAAAAAAGVEGLAADVAGLAAGVARARDAGIEDDAVRGLGLYDDEEAARANCLRVGDRRAGDRRYCVGIMLGDATRTGRIAWRTWDRILSGLRCVVFGGWNS